MKKFIKDYLAMDFMEHLFWILLGLMAGQGLRILLEML